MPLFVVSSDRHGYGNLVHLSDACYRDLALGPGLYRFYEIQEKIHKFTLVELPKISE